MNKAELIHQIKTKQNFLCVGLDTDPALLPAHLKSHPHAVFEFNKAIIDATKAYCTCYKINTAFYEAQGLKGWEAMEQTVHYIPSTHFKIADAKRGDIGNTSAQYAKTFFEVLPFDAVTVAPYMGEDSVRPFLEYENKFAIVLALTSNLGSNNFQQMAVYRSHDTYALIPDVVQAHRQHLLYECVLETVASWGNTNNLMFVVGATQAAELKHIRDIVPEHFLLVPGVGTQGGSLKEVALNGLNAEAGLLVNASRAVIYAGKEESFAQQAGEAARQYATEMSGYLTALPG